MRGRVCAVVGGQYGSEAKGAYVAHVADKWDCHVRVGGANAGHTFYKDGVRHVQQAIPCGWVNPRAQLIIGRGAVVDLRQVSTELGRLPLSVRSRLLMDGAATVATAEHLAAEGGVTGEIHRRIGSTGHGVGAARASRAARDQARHRTVWDASREFFLDDRTVEDTAAHIRALLASGISVLLEGTQGVGLSLTHGPWPYVTSADTTPATLLADTGIPAQWLTDVVMVVRTYPIRVAGNSGPVRNEITWDELSARLGRDVSEQTTVTKKIRRIGEWDEQLFWDSFALCQPTQLAVTMVDYLTKDDLGVTKWNDLSAYARHWLISLARRSHTPITYASTSPTTIIEDLPWTW